MPLDRLVERILNDAREQAKRIKSGSQEKRDEIIAEADREAKERHEGTLSAARRTAEEEKKKRVTMASLEARKEMLAEKQSLIQEVFDRAIQAIRDLPDEQYVEMMVRQLVTAVRDRRGELFMSPDDSERLGDEIVDRANAALEMEGLKGGLTLAPGSRDISGGFILRIEGIEINNSLEAQINSRREEFEPRVVEILFGGQR